MRSVHTHTHTHTHSTHTHTVHTHLSVGVDSGGVALLQLGDTRLGREGGIRSREKVVASANDGSQTSSDQRLREEMKSKPGWIGK